MNHAPSVGELDVDAGDELAQKAARKEMSFDEILDARQEMSESFKRKMKETNLSDFPCDHDVRKLIFDALRERYGSLNGCVGPTWAGRGRLDAC